MSDTHFPLSEEDDLPRSFRRARQEQDAAQMTTSAAFPPSAAPLSSPNAYAAPAPVAANLSGQPVPAVVRSIKVPFFKLVFFFIKAVFAAIPALIMLGALLWYGGEMLKTYYPDALQMKITIESVNTSKP